MHAATATYEKHVRPRRADKRDGEVGKRIRSRRLELNLSQTELADKIGVTFQQVQKYEKGVNRVGAGRLDRIAGALNVPHGFFFDDTKKPGAVASEEASVFGMMQTKGSVRIVQAFHKIKGRKIRLLLVELAEEIVRLEEGSE